MILSSRCDVWFGNIRSQSQYVAYAKSLIVSASELAEWKHDTIATFIDLHISVPSHTLKVELKSSNVQTETFLSNNLSVELNKQNLKLKL